MFRLLVLIQIVLIHALLCMGNNASKDELLSVIVIFRHGDRTPLQPFPIDPNGDRSLWPVPFGELTNIGKMQHYQLGQWLRKRYDGFLNKQYSKDEVYVRSTNVDRTLMSAEANLAGLFPSKESELWKLKWDPIPVDNLPKKDDYLLINKLSCDRYDTYKNELLESKKFVDINKKNQLLYDYLTKYTGIIVTNIQSLQFVYDNLLIQSLYNLTLPEWAEDVFPGEMKEGAELSFAIPCYTREMARFKVGPLMDDIAERFTKSLEGKGEKFVIYSAHDSTIANVLQALNVFHPHCPPYAATIMLELRNSSVGAKYVNVLYKKESDVPEQLSLPHCGVNCSFPVFDNLLESIRMKPGQYGECKFKFWELITLMKIIYAGTILLGVLLTVGLVYCIWGIHKQGYEKIGG